MDKSENITELIKALGKVQPLLNPAVKDKTNPFLKSKYADLSSVWESCRGLLSSNGLVVTQVGGMDTAGNYLETVLMHESGQWISGRYPLKPVKTDDPQALGSAMTYARRYNLAAILGIVTEDDDAEGAMGRQSDTKQKTETKTPAKPETSKDEWDKLRRPEQVPGSNEWILSKMFELKIDEAKMLEYLNKELHIPIETTVKATLEKSKISDTDRATIAKKINAKQGAK